MIQEVTPGSRSHNKHTDLSLTVTYCLFIKCIVVDKDTSVGHIQTLNYSQIEYFRFKLLMISVGH